MRCTPLIAGLAAALALTACGSTVQVSERQALTGSAGGLTGGSSGDLAGGAVDGASGLGGVAASGDATGPDVAAGGTTTSGATSGGTSGASPAGGGRAAASRPGTGSSTSAGPVPGRPAGAAPTGKATGSPVEVGVVIYPDISAAAAAFGGTADVGDQKGEVRDALAWVNAHGGFGGHVVTPVYYEVELTSTQTYAVTYQEICATFTEDHKVVAAIVLGNAEAGLPACLAKGGALLLAHGHYLHNASDFQRFANLVTPEEVDSDLAARELVDLILARGLAKRGESLGLLVMDYPAPLRARDAIIVPRLKAAGIDVVSYTVGYPQSTPDVANSASAVQSAQLAMAARGVKTVTFLCPGCAPFFLDDAEQQAYYPQYVLTSFDTLGGYEGKGRSRSLKTAVALGWEPLKDTNSYRDRGKVLSGNPTFSQCSTIQKRHIKGDASLFASVSFCGAMLNLKAAADAVAGSPLTVPSLVRGFESLGASSPGVGNFATRLAPGRHFGIAGLRTMRYDGPCDCFRYDAGATRAFS